MLYLNFAPRPDLLLPSLIEAVRPAWNDVPSASFVVQSCDRQMAETASGGETGMRSQSTDNILETVLWDIRNPDENMVFLHKEKLQQIICALLTDELLEKENFAPLKYLKDEGTIDPVKKVSSHRKSPAFSTEYSTTALLSGIRICPHRADGESKGWSRPAVKTALLFREGGKNEHGSESEIWQRDLYILFGKQGLLAADRKIKISTLSYTSQLYRLRHDPLSHLTAPLFSSLC